MLAESGKAFGTQTHRYPSVSSTAFENMAYKKIIFYFTKIEW